MKKYQAALISFIVVLMFMPIGHAMMVFIEEFWPNAKYLGAVVLGIVGAALLILGIFKNNNRAVASILGLISGVLVWTGWVEFSFMWIAEKEGVSPLMENGEIATKPEYLVMLSTLGLLGPILLYFALGRNNCTFFVWIQKKSGLGKHLKTQSNQLTKPLALTTFIETIVLLWTFYILLLLVYDKQIAGDQHPITYIVAFGSLLWAAWLFNRLLLIKKFDYAIRYAIPTVIIFWNFIEIIGRWDLLDEIWVKPFEHWIENSLLLGILLFFIVSFIRNGSKKRTNPIDQNSKVQLG